MIKNVYSVGQVNNYIKNMFSQDFLLKRISIKGEVSNCKYHTSGHIYFTIKDSSGTINAIMFAGNRRGLNFQMKEGDKVIVTGSVEIYERNGSYQIYAREIELDGEGNLYLKFEALKRELEEMGMFAPEYKQPIPRYAKRIGIVTAPTGAAVQDIRNISYRRNPYVQLILYPALVQGDGAAESIVNGIRALEHIGVDVIIVGRGGGAIEDLWAFNEEMVASAIFDCQIPIISAVGHESDWTIADYVADMRAPTPSAAAELAVYDYRLIVSAFAEAKRRMDNILIRRIELKREQLSHMKTRIEYLSPQRKLNDNRRRLVDYSDRIDELMQRIIIDKKNRLRLLAGTLYAYSPAKKLSQGYAFVEGIDGKAVKSINSTKPGDEIGIHFIDGSVKAVVSEVYSNE